MLCIRFCVAKFPLSEDPPVARHERASAARRASATPRAPTPWAQSWPARTTPGSHGACVSLNRRGWGRGTSSATGSSATATTTPATPGLPSRARAAGRHTTLAHPRRCLVSRSGTDATGQRRAAGLGAPAAPRRLDAGVRGRRAPLPNGSLPTTAVRMSAEPSLRQPRRDRHMTHPPGPASRVTAACVELGGDVVVCSVYIIRIKERTSRRLSIYNLALGTYPLYTFSWSTRIGEAS